MSGSILSAGALLANRHARAVCFLLVLCAGVLIVYPRHDFLQWFDPGDHGRDLYAFERSLHGEIPYRDYYWNYGPLMPFVYGAFYEVFGCQISSALLGRLCFSLLAAVFLYLAVSELFAPVIAFLAAVWFLVFFPDFWHTFNHTAGIAMIAAVLWAIFSYIKSSKPRDAFLGLLWGFLLVLIKPNFGVVAVAMGVMGVLLTDTFKRTPWKRSKTLFCVAAAGLIPVLTCVIYGWCLKDLSITDMRQCLPYIGDDDPHSVTPFTALKELIQFIRFAMRINPIHACLGVILGCAVVRAAYLLAARKFEPVRRTQITLALVMLAAFYVGSLHEYLASGVWYRALWGDPLCIALGFVIIDVALSNASRLLRFQTQFAIALMAVLVFASNLRLITAQKTPVHFLPGKHAGVYLGSSPEWIQTVETATAFLNKTLKNGERFFALPYDPLYYFLTDRISPTRHLMFFRHNKIAPEQEASVIADIERHHINYVLLGNLYKSKTEARILGTLGETHCLIIGRYLDDHFVPIATFGDWANEPGGLWNHGVRILRRKEPAISSPVSAATPQQEETAARSSSPSPVRR